MVFLRQSATARAPRSLGRRLVAVDSHTAGQQTRVIVEGLPEVPGHSLREVRDRFADEHDWVRLVAAQEPRGQRSMFVAALVPSFDPACLCGVVFMDPAGYHDMCGHATIGVVTTLVNLGYVECSDGENELALETPAGPVSVRAIVRDGRAESVAFVNRPAFLLERVSIAPTPGSHATVTVAYGGQWYAFVNAADFGLRVEPERIDELIAKASYVREQLAAAISAPDPESGKVPLVGNIVWCDEPSGQEADARNVPVNAAGGFDRSPCGTATCARLAILHSKGSLAVGETFVNQGLLKTLYRGRVVAETHVDGHPAVVPEIEGSAWLTGRLELWVEDGDPFPDGFLIP